MKVLGLIAIATVLALSSSSPAFAKHHRHHHAMHGMTVGMSPGPSGPRLHAGGVDESRPGGRGVSRKPSE
jgi:hypothetical protein